MSDRITSEGATLADAIQGAAASLGISTDDVDFEYDREHLAGGGATVRIFATKRQGGGPRGRVDAPKPRHDPRRDAEVKQRGQAAIDQVSAGQDQAVVPDLNSYERRLVHMLARDQGLATESIGDGNRKDVVVKRA